MCYQIPCLAENTTKCHFRKNAGKRIEGIPPKKGLFSDNPFTYDMLEHLLVMLVLMFFIQTNEFILAYGGFHWIYFRFRSFENFLRLQPVVGVFYVFAVLHHPVNVVTYPSLLFIQRLHAHVTQ